jgi:hypothetical protein
MYLSSRLNPFLRRVLFASATTGVVLAGLAGSATAATDDAAPFTCSNRSLRGDYGSAIDGTLFFGPTTALLRGVVMTRYDGNGHFTQVDFAQIDGVAVAPDWRPGAGTYQINPDCTGTAVIHSTDGDLHLRLVVVDRGRQVISVVEGHATGSWGVKVR